MTKRITVRDIQSMKAAGTPIPMVTAYDYTSARLVDEAGFPMLLVGDSLAQGVLGYESTIPVTLDDMVRATGAVGRGVSRALVVADLPFMSYQVNADDAMRSAGRLLKEGGAHAVKLEGGRPAAEAARRLGDAGIAVMGHIGLTPQSVHKLGGYRVQGRAKSDAERLLDEAAVLEDAGVFALVLELVPAEVAQDITNRLSIPTIGIGAGARCDGQVQVFHDLLGLSLDFTPKHAGRYEALGDRVRDALQRYREDVEIGAFPTESQTSHVKGWKPAEALTG